MSKGNGQRPFIYNLYEKPLDGGAIERRSFEIIDREAPAHNFTADQWQVVRRMIHTTGDFSIMQAVHFSPEALACAADALKSGCPIYVDSRMIQSGLSLERLQTVNPQYLKDRLYCHIADDDVAKEASASGLPRSIFAVRKAKEILSGGIAVFGNAPAALLELNRMIAEEGIRPALVIAMPVGFVHVEESKNELLSLGVPCIALEGRRGGSPLAVCVIHALCSLAAASNPHPLQGAGNDRFPSPSPGEGVSPEAVILIGHGSRVAGAGESMEQVADGLRRRLPGMIIETCAMSMLGPHLPETIQKCVDAGAGKIMVMPYFLYMGIHLREDIPEIIRNEGDAYPGVQFILGKHLAYDPCLIDLVVRRLEESRGLADIRQV